LNGTTAVPTAVVNGDVLGQLQLGGYDGTAVNNGSSFFGVAEGDWTAVSHPAGLVLGTTPAGAISQVRRWAVTSDGHLLAGHVSNGTGDNSYDIGASGAQRPRTGYFGTSVVAPAATFSSTTDASTSTSGAVTIAGGLGVAKAIYSGTSVVAPYGNFTSGVSTSALTADSLILLAPVWDDVNLPATTGKLGGSGNPTWAAVSTNLYGYTFAANDYLDLQDGELPHGYKAGTYIEPHVHILSNGSEAGATAVRFQLFYSFSSDGGATSSEMSSVATQVIPSATTSLTHFRLSLGTVAMAGYNFGTIIKSRIKRLAVLSGSTPAANPFVEQVGWHYQRETLGAGTF
jgi:hypothetical protein